MNLPSRTGIPFRMEGRAACPQAAAGAVGTPRPTDFLGNLLLPRILRGLGSASAGLVIVAMNALSASDSTLIDFTNATHLATWQVVNDDVMGGRSSSRFQVTNGVAVFRGEVSLENNGGFASVRSLPARHDLAGGDAFLIRVRGDGRRYKFTVRTDRSFDRAIYQAAFTTRKDEWEEHRLPLKDFVPTSRGRVLTAEPPLDPAKISSVGFLISDQQSGPFQLEIAWIKVTAIPHP